MNFRSYITDRLFEWVMTLGMLGVAIEVMIWPGTIGASAFRIILRLVDAEHLGLFFLFFGIVRAVALVANGSIKYGNWLRVLGSSAAALLWAQLCVALMILGPIGPTLNSFPSPGIPIYFALTIGELISAYRAASDDRHTS